MDFKIYADVKAFYTDVYDVLMADEAQNMLILGNLIIGYEGKDTFDWRDPANWVMATASDGGAVRLVALMTPPFGITLYAVGDFAASVKCLADGLIAANINVPGVVTEKALAAAFADVYCAAMGLKPAVATEMRIYELVAVNADVPKSGRFRPADARDLSFVPYWMEGFYAEATSAKDPVISDIEKYRHAIGDMYVLEDGGCVVATAKISRKTASAACVSFVYTPPYFRGRGYASSVVAHLSQKCLDDGFKSCVLYTDLANPTSNSIYQKIGYNPIADSLEIKFTP